ncbi:hypothetical protein ACF0H5_021462 [Mactra antiquata]
MSTLPSLKDLTYEQKYEAFKKVQAETNIPGVRLELVTEKYYDDAIIFMRDNFVLKEPICTALDLKWSDMLEAIWREACKESLSLMFVDDKTNEFIAMRSTKIAYKDENLDESMLQMLSLNDAEESTQQNGDETTQSTSDNPYKDEPLDIMSMLPSQELKYAFEFTKQYDDKANFFDHFGVTEAFHFYGLAVSENYKRKGYAEKIVRASISMIRHLGLDPVYIKGEASSNYSRRIYDKIGMEELCDQKYRSWTAYDGTQPIQNTGVHESVTVYGYRVKQNGGD